MATASSTSAAWSSPVASGRRCRRSTWNALRDLGLVEFYGPAHKPRARLRLTGAAA